MKDNNIFSYFPFTPISNDFINKYMLQTNPVFTVIYIYFLNKFINNEQIILDNTCDEIDILKSDLIKALEYWKEKNLIEFEITNDILKINFINKIEKEEKKVIQKKEMSYTEEEITYFSQKEEVRQLFKIAEKKLAKTLTYSDRRKIVELFCNYDITLEIFTVLITYCKDKKSNVNFNYIEKVAIDWVQNGIDSTEKVENYIKMYDENFKKIMECFAIRSNAPAPIQIEYMKRWLIEFNLPIDVILEACKRTMLKTGQANFDYTEGILKNWSKYNIKTLDGIKANQEKYNLEKQTKHKLEVTSKSKIYKQPPSQNKFINFDQSNVDFKKLRELEIKKLKGEI